MSFLLIHTLTAHKGKQEKKIPRNKKLQKIIKKNSQNISKNKFPKKILKKWQMAVIFTSYGVGCIPINIRKGE